MAQRRIHFNGSAAGCSNYQCSRGIVSGFSGYAAIDTVRSLCNPTAEGDWTSVAICSEGQYGIDKGLIASMPVRCESDGVWSVVEGVEIDDFSKSKIEESVSELREERDAVSDLIPS